MDGKIDQKTHNVAKTLSMGHASAQHIPWRNLGQYQYRVLSDGEQTQQRLSVVESSLPGKSAGPIFHFHEMHDEVFYVTKGKVRFHSPARENIDAGPGDMVTMPIRLPHKFSNPFEEEAVFISIFAPGFFIRYFETLEDMIGEGKTLTPEVNMAALKRFATVPLTEEMVKAFEDVYKQK